MADLLIKKIQIGSQAYSVYDERVQKPVPANAKFTDTTYDAERGIVLSQGKFGHSNSIGAQSTQGLYKISWDAYGHITGVTGVQKSDITTLGIPAQDTTYGAEKGISLSSEGKFGHSNTAITAVTTDAVFKKIKYDAYGHITGVVDVEKGDITKLGIPGQDTTYAGEGGITVSNGKIKHSNTPITAVTTDAVFKKIKYDAYGHITGTKDVEPRDITPLIGGATSEITKLQTLVNSIKAELENPSAEGGLKSVLDTMQDILNSSAKAVTNISYTPQALSVTNGVLSISNGAVTPTTDDFVTANKTVTPITPKA